MRCVRIQTTPFIHNSCSELQQEETDQTHQSITWDNDNMNETSHTNNSEDFVKGQVNQRTQSLHDEEQDIEAAPQLNYKINSQTILGAVLTAPFLNLVPRNFAVRHIPAQVIVREHLAGNMVAGEY